MTTVPLRETSARRQQPLEQRQQQRQQQRQKQRRLMHAAARSRSPPGTWRLFAPGLVTWAITAAAITAPGAGAWIAVIAAGVGVLLALSIAIGQRLKAASNAAGARNAAQESSASHGVDDNPAESSPPRSARRLWPIRGVQYLAVLCAMLVLVGARIDAVEQARADPLLSSAAETGKSVRLGAAEGVPVTVAGYPETFRSIAGERVSIRATVHAPAGPLPVTLWIDAAPKGVDAPPSASSEAGGVTSSTSGTSAEFAAWGPGTALAVTGTPVARPAESATAFGVQVDQVEAVDGGWQSEVAQFAAELRLGLRAAAGAVHGAELVPGMAVGDTALVSESLEASMKEASLLHLVAVSGANCALVVSAIVWLASLGDLPRRGRIVLAGIALSGFVVLVGPDASVQRAAAMATVLLLSQFGGKRASALPSLAVAMFALLCADPWQALQAGFALSVAATAGILLFTPSISHALRRATRLRTAMLPSWCTIPVAVALAAQLTCGPLLLLLEPGIPAVGVLANVIAGPAAPLGTGIGLLALLALPLSEPAGRLLTWMASVPASWVAATADVSAALPLARWPWPGGPAGAILLAAVETAILCAWLLLTRRVELGRAGAKEPSGWIPWRGRRPAPLRVQIAVALLISGAAGVFAGPTLVVPITTRAGTPDDWLVVACDVGQGDALLLRDPATPEHAMLVDTGDDPELLEACLDRFSIDRLALVVLSHDDRDHVGAVGAVVDRTKHALVAPDNQEDGRHRPVLAQLAAAGASYQVGSAGDRGSVGALQWEVLAPRTTDSPADSNSASLVMMVTVSGVRVLLLADTGEDEQQRLMWGGADVRADVRADVLKVAHHGSSDQSAELARIVGAQYGLISVGADNTYGHPTGETVRMLQKSSTLALRTDELGSIALSSGAGEEEPLRVWVERGE